MKSKNLLLGLAFLSGATVPAFADSITLAWAPAAGGTVAGYRIVYGTAPGSHPNSIDVGSNATGTVTGLTAGQRYYFAVIAYDSGGQTSPESSEVNGVALGLTSLSANTIFPAGTGAPITWTARGGAATNIEYRFWRYSYATGAWAIVQDYAPSNAYTWTPAAGDQGRYVIQVWARAVGSSETVHTWRSSGDFTISNAVTVGAVAADAGLPASTGRAITWQAQAVGGPAPLQYRFYRYNMTTNQWSLARDYSISNSYTWTPTGSDVGSYFYQVWVKGAGSSAPYDAWRNSETFEIKNAPPAVASLQADKPSPAGTGGPITWTAVAAGGPGPIEYQFWRQNVATNVWTQVQNYSTSNTFTWTPSSSETGTYQLQVWIRRQGSAASLEAWGSSGTFQIVNAAPAITSITTDAGQPVGVGRPVTWTVNATGGSGGLSYKFWLYNPANDVWSLLQDYSTSNKFTWTPQAGDIGNFSLQVWVRNSTSSATLNTAANAPPITVLASMPVVRAVAADSSAGRVGAPIAWAATTTGGDGLVEYKFWRFDAVRQVWTMVQDYSWNNTYRWVPQIGDEGAYSVQVWIRRAGSSAAYESVGSSAATTIAPN
jgi:hypothetical protein